VLREAQRKEKEKRKGKKRKRRFSEMGGGEAGREGRGEEESLRAMFLIFRGARWTG